MKIRVIFILSIFSLIFMSSSYASTYVSGSVSGHWTIAGSPYIVTGDIIINPGSTLIIDPGVVVKFSLNTGLYVRQGDIKALGTAEQPIYFTSIDDNSVGGNTGNGNPQPGSWKNIYFEAYSCCFYYNNFSNSLLQYTVIRYGGGNSAGNINVNNNAGNSYIPKLTISNCTISNSSNYGIYITASDTSYQANPTIKNTRFIANQYHTYSEVANTITAEYNWWGQSPPDTSKFYGSIDYDPYLTYDPYGTITPSEFSGIAISTYSIKWIWKDNSSTEIGYRIRSQNGSILADLPANTTYWIESNLNSNTPYTRYAEVYNNFDSNISNSSTIYTLTSIPSNLSAGEETSSSIAISWSGDGTRYKIERAPDVSGSPGNWTTMKSWSDSITSNKYIDTSLQSNTTYWYRITAYNGDGIEGPPSEPIAWQTGPGVPGTPTDGGQWSTTTLLTFNWTQGEAIGAQYYHIQIGNTPGSNNVLDTEIPAIYTSTQIVGSDGLTYYIRVRAKNSNGRYGNWTNSSDGITIDITPPSASIINFPTHPYPTAYYLMNSPEFILTNNGDISGVDYHYYEFDQNPNTIPTITSSVTYSNTLKFSNLADGSYYLHVLPRDRAGNLGTSVSHFQVNILTTL
jgi:hypothetical protein